MSLKREVCKHCSSRQGGKFEKRGIEIKMDYDKTVSVDVVHLSPARVQYVRLFRDTKSQTETPKKYAEPVNSVSEHCFTMAFGSC